MRRALLLHGFSGTPNAFGAMRRALSPDWECVCPELPGHGQNPGPLMSRSFQGGIADFAAALRAALGVPRRKLHLLGYSLGARTALGLLDCVPEFFASAGLLGVHPGLTSDTERHARARADADWIRLLRNQGVEAFSEAWAAQPLFESQSALAAATIDEQRAARRLHTAAGLAWSLETFGLAAMPSYWHLLRRPPVPTRLIVGEHDGQFRELAERAVGLNRCVGLTIIAASGHNPVLEQPSALARAFEEGAAHD